MYITPIFYGITLFEDEAAGPSFGLADLMVLIIRANPMYYFVEYFRDVVYRCSAHEAYMGELLAKGEAVSQAVMEAAQLPSFGETFVLYAIGLITTLIGAIVFMGTKRKFIYNI
jgi:ABC-type polysaccharide/polyol phosphate export permease